MGHHYLPQYYLRGFSRENLVWVHDRIESRSFASQPKTIANENNLYTEELENQLANEIEGPANPILDKVRDLQPITDEEKRLLATYLFVLWKRVPRARERFAAGLPTVAASVRQELHAGLSAAAAELPNMGHVAEWRRAEVDRIIARIELERPPSLWHESLTRESSANVIGSMMTMHWRFLHSKSEDFVTSDNPVFFFEHEGIGQASSELTVPLSSSVALWANRRPTAQPRYIEARPAAVREINRRMAHNASRYLYSKSNGTWILPFLSKGEYALNRLM